MQGYNLLPENSTQLWKIAVSEVISIKSLCRRVDAANTGTE